MKVLRVKIPTRAYPGGLKGPAFTGNKMAFAGNYRQEGARLMFHGVVYVDTAADEADVRGRAEKLQEIPQSQWQHDPKTGAVVVSDLGPGFMD